MSGFEEIAKNSRLRPAGYGGQVKLKTKSLSGIFFSLQPISEFQKKEIKFHNAIHQDEEEIHQLRALRNQFYHNYFKKYLYQLPQNSVILEIGAGSGFDLLPLLKKGYSVIVSDISVKSVKFVKLRVESCFPQYRNKVIYLVADGQNLPLDDNSLDAVYMVATLHHFENQLKALTEIKRVTKKDGLVILAMEPSRLMMWFTKLFAQSKKLRLHKGQSAADETHHGYAKNDFKKLIRDYSSSVIKVKRVWLLLGFLHYALEAIYRLCKLKKRVKIPRPLEWLLLFFDEILLKIPIINQLNWHWIIVFKNF